MAGIDKQLVARRFGRRVATYEAVTPVQGRMADQLLNDLPPPRDDRLVRRIVELGCGTGRLTRQLVKRYPDAHTLAVDISTEMIEHARKSCPQAEFLAADAETLASQIAPGVDLIVSNAAVQWFNDPVAALRQYRSRLARDGILAVTTLGDQTFNELRQALTAAYGPADSDAAAAHLLDLFPAGFWRRQLPDAIVREHLWVKQFADVQSFLRSLQQAGVGQSGRPNPVLPMRILRRMIDHYATVCADGSGIRATYHVLSIQMASRTAGSISDKHGA